MGGMAGHMHRQPSGSWRLSVYGGIDPATGTKRRVTRTVHGSKKEAGEALARLVLEVAEQRRIESQPKTFGQACTDWLDQHGPDLSPGTVENYQGYIRFLPAKLAALPCEKLTVEDFDTLYTRLRKEGLSPATIVRRHGFYRSVLNQEVRRRHLTFNPAAFAHLPKVRKPDTVKPDAEVVRRVLAAIPDKNFDFRVLVRLAVATGARRGELAALQWKHVDLTNGVVTFERTAVQVRGRVVYKRPKNDKARYVPIGPAMVETLTGYKRQMRETLLTLGVPVDRNTPVFIENLREGATPIRPDGIDHRWARVRRLADLDGLVDNPDLLDFHALRRAFATIMQAEKVDAPVVTKMIGHSKQSTTADFYTGTVSGSERAAAELMDRVLTG